jgi:hypothetical protein
LASEEVLAHLPVRALIVRDRAGNGVAEVRGFDELLGGIDFRVLHGRMVVEQGSQQRFKERDLLRLGEVFGPEQVIEPGKHECF